jgi:hypothetical protein
MSAKRLLSVLTLLLLAAPVSLEAAGIYLGAGLGNDVEGGSFRAGLEQFADSSGDRSKLFAGLRISRYLAVEAARHDFGRQTCCRQIADLGFDSDVEAVSVAVLGRWPMRVATPFVKAGLLSWEEDGALITIAGPQAESADGTDPLVGVGVEMRLISNVGLRVEWERYEFADSSSEGVWVSLLLRFGERRR